jgi:hypothetical protein
VSGAEITSYAATLRGYLVAVGADNAQLSALTAAAQALADLADSLPGPRRRRNGRRPSTAGTPRATPSAQGSPRRC